MLKRLRLLARALFERNTADAELDEELRFHVEQQTKLYVREGMPETEARRRAVLALGGVQATREAYRDGSGARPLDELRADIRYAVRALWRDRGLSAAAVLTLALGIGATSAVFSAMNAVVLRDLPFREPDRLVQAWEENADRNWHKNVVAPANFLDWREQVGAFASTAGYTDYQTTVTLLGRGEPQLLTAAYATENLLDVLGVRPQLGSGFPEGVDFENGLRPVIISGRLWRNQFGGDPAVIGQSVSFGDARPWQIVGVLPDDYAFPSPLIDVWMPMLWSAGYRNSVSFRRAHWLRVVARLQPGVTVESATAALQTVMRRLETQYPATNTHMGAGITPLHEWVVGNTRRPLVVLLSAAGVLLLIACANVGNLLLLHALRRARDVSLRIALGASRGRVARQALTESLVLSMAGGMLGFGIGWAGAQALLALQPPGMLPVHEIGLDLTVLAFAITVTTASGIAFGVAPAVMATRQAPAKALSAGGRAVSGTPVRRWGRQLVVAEVALAVVLLVGAGLLVRSYDRLSRVPAGFNPTGVLTLRFGIPASRYDSASKVLEFWKSVVERANAMPGVERAAAVRQLPVNGVSWSSTLAIKGRAPLPQTDILHREVLGDYFQVMEVPLLSGRTFTQDDRGQGQPVVVINDALAKQFFPGEDPVGQLISFDRIPDSASVWRIVVGVVGSERQANLAEPARPEIFAPFVQDWTRTMTLVARVAPPSDPMALAGSMQRMVREIDPLIAFSEVRSMTQVHEESRARERFTSVLILVFALSGVALALVGVFGVLAQLVQSRWREMGIRMALGAQRREVRGVVLRQGVVLLGVGIGVGLLAALAASRLLTTMLFEVAATDVVTYVGVAAMVAVAGLLASWIPAWRASAADPAITLRSD
jgi:putative ABC transport system permease protein